MKKEHKENNENSLYVNFLKILKLETTTPSGRINLAGVIVLAIFCILYTTEDALMFFFSVAGDTIKSVALKQDVHHPYQGSGLLEAIIPVLIGFLMCITYLYVDDKKKNELKKTDIQEVENPLENL